MTKNFVPGCLFCYRLYVTRSLLCFELTARWPKLIFLFCYRAIVDNESNTHIDILLGTFSSWCFFLFKFLLRDHEIFHCVLPSKIAE